MYGIIKIKTHVIFTYITVALKVSTWKYETPIKKSKENNILKKIIDIFFNELIFSCIMIF